MITQTGFGAALILDQFQLVAGSTDRLIAGVGGTGVADGGTAVDVAAGTGVLVGGPGVLVGRGVSVGFGVLVGNGVLVGKGVGELTGVALGVVVGVRV